MVLSRSLWQMDGDTMKRFAAMVLLMLGIGLGCQKAQPSYVTVPEPANAPGNERAFVAYALEHLSPTLEQVTCHCCNKTLKTCLGGMGVPGGCPFT